MELFGVYTDFIAAALKRIRVKVSAAGVEIGFDREEGLGIDERIRKIDKARENLVEGLAAIDELKQSAERSTTEARAALEQLAQLKLDKQSLEAIIATDVRVFREVAGIPSLPRSKERGLSDL